MRALLSPLEVIFRDIERALNYHVFYAAIAVTLSIPDICACLSDPPGSVWATSKKYIAWCDENLAGLFQMNGDDFHRMRGGVLHQGSAFGHRDSRFKAVAFTLPSVDGGMHNNVGNMNGVVVLNLDAVTFCKDVIEAARRWRERNATNPNVLKNEKHIMRYRANGLDPYFVGLPVIA